LLIYYKDNGYLNLLVGFIVLINYWYYFAIHGITWAKYTKDGFKSIRLEYFGNWLPIAIAKAIISQTLYNWRIIPAIVFGLFFYYPLSLAMYFLLILNIFHNGRLWWFYDFFMLLKENKVLYWIILQKLAVISTENMKFKYLNFKLFDHI
jgi:hypothetical protein